VIGPIYDLASLWEKHAYYEFVERDADKTISTMVETPYVNHVPVRTGGTGKRELRHFYHNYFVHMHSEDWETILVSRTVGANRLVDEMVSCFTHDRLMDYLLPGIAPTGRRIMLAGTGIITFRGRKLRHEHIYFDQATLLAQIGVLDPGKYPISGSEHAHKVLEPFKYPSNEMMTTWEPPR
jgi:carboxymethylenebutenolidase